jgi:hypothetical protein
MYRTSALATNADPITMSGTGHPAPGQDVSLHVDGRSADTRVAVAIGGEVQAGSTGPDVDSVRVRNQDRAVTGDEPPNTSGRRVQYPSALERAVPRVGRLVVRGVDRRAARLRGGRPGDRRDATSSTANAAAGVGGRVDDSMASTVGCSDRAVNPTSTTNATPADAAANSHEADGRTTVASRGHYR